MAAVFEEPHTEGGVAAPAHVLHIANPWIQGGVHLPDEVDEDKEGQGNPDYYERPNQNEIDEWKGNDLKYSSHLTHIPVRSTTKILGTGAYTIL